MTGTDWKVGRGGAGGDGVLPSQVHGRCSGCSCTVAHFFCLKVLVLIRSARPRHWHVRGGGKGTLSLLLIS